VQRDVEAGVVVVVDRPSRARELRASRAYGKRNAVLEQSSRRPAMSTGSRLIASTRTDFVSGCGALSDGAEASRLSEKLVLIARS
jgi:hypothetical protein